MTATTRFALLLALATFALALTIRLLGVDLREPWLDEIYSQFAISRDWFGLAKDRITRGHSPLYFALMKALGIDGANIVAMRTASAIFDSAGAAILAAALALHVNRPAALFFGFFYAWSPLAVHWAQNARPYGLLIFFLAIGLTGAMGLLATLGRDSADATQRPRRLFAFGFSMASLTITAGIFAFLSTALLPFLLPRTRRDKAFLQRWKQALKVPGIVAVLAYFIVSGPHIARNVDGYWAEKYNTLGLEGLGNLWVSAVIDVDPAVALTRLSIAPELAPPLIWTISILLVSFVAIGLTACRTRPGLLALAFLMIGYTFLMICVSAWTSVLVPRYFLPPWIALLALAATGMAAARSRTRWSWLAIAPLMLVFATLGFLKATQPGVPQDRALAPVAEIIALAPPETVRILYERTDGTRNKLIKELFPLRFGRAELDRPALSSWRLDRFTGARAEGQDIFAFVSEEKLAGILAETGETPACIHGFGDWHLAYWGRLDTICTR
ncbi:hypothetical protein R3X27_07280 [Tropicimonas sp. TH_r6]|uniref:hypothetical protein n=1 Tax=Tropicimonas sp. TH_r6 TaxID=3082085 RepID=UPI00295599CC|nr:hypothetical protein [Tropicimonas sp. TH_r6]MDV7142482.1 hypothetical protein [Tropicimonas sp. TH_r6]